MFQNCCITMEGVLEEPNSSLKYNPITRTYLMDYQMYRKPRKNDAIVSERLSYCPFCGTKLPKQLNKELYRILQEEYHIEDTRNQIHLGNIPIEFKTDEWWKKRGL